MSVIMFLRKQMIFGRDLRSMILWIYALPLIRFLPLICGVLDGSALGVISVGSYLG